MSLRTIVEGLIQSGLINKSELSHQLNPDKSKPYWRGHVQRKMTRSRLSKLEVERIADLLKLNKDQVG